MRRQRQRGVTLMIGTMSMIFLIPLIGLGIDVGFLFAVKSKLQAAVDGGALAAARALSLGSSTSSQQASAQAHASNWFNANFPSGYFGTHTTTMATNNPNCSGTVTACIYNDPSNPNLQHVAFTATTQVDTFFMKWFGYNYTVVGASSDATRRDVVAMMVLDRSGSMNTSGACPNLISAAKIFTGQFAAGRDYIGAVSYSDGTYLHSAPSTNFQTVLGYANDSGTAAGQLDTIQCNGGTGTPEAVSIAYDQLYKTNLPGALNMIMFETDGLPNTMVFNWWDGANTVAGIASTSGCKDANAKTKAQGGFGSLAALPNWTTGHTMSSTAYSNVPAGIVASMYSFDPWQSPGFYLAFNPWQTGVNSSNNSIYLTSNGCQWQSGNLTTNITDLAWTPLQDVYGNQMNPATNPFQGAVTTLSGPGTTKYLSLAGSTQTQWTNFHKGVLNATDNAAYQVRTNGTLPAYVFGIGLGGNCTPNCTAANRTGDPPDYILMQRMANDPNGDLYNTPPNYTSCATEPTCVNYSGQPQGTFIYSYDKTQLVQAFLSVSSQVLRLSH